MNYNHYESTAPSPTEQGLPAHPWPAPVGDVIATRRDRRTLEGLVATYGSPFKAYLEHVWVDAPVDAMEAEFANVYVATCSGEDELIESILAGLGWGPSLRRFLDEQGIPEDALEWNHGALMRATLMAYEIRERDGQWHLFSA